MDGLRLQMSIYPLCDKFGLTTVALKVRDILDYTSIDPMVQRKLSLMQRRKISNYLQERELDQVFFGPVTLSMRDVDSLACDGEEMEKQNYVLKQGSKLSILDGQHRILALGYVGEQMLREVRRNTRKLTVLKLKQKKEPGDASIQIEVDDLQSMIESLEQRRLALMESELAVQIYIGLNEEEEKQLFGDINSKVQLVSKELGHSFDSVDPINLVIQQVGDHHPLLKEAGIEKRNSLTAFNRNFTCYSWLYSIATMLFSGKMQPSYELMRNIRRDLSFYVEVLHQFYSTLLPLMPEKPGLSQFTSANRVMQESIALYANHFLFQNGEYNEDWTSCLRILDGFDWTHRNEELFYIFGMQDNGKLNLIHEKSLRKHSKLLKFFMEGMEEPGDGSDIASLA
jgi:DNA-sulfur modification-associated